MTRLTDRIRNSRVRKSLVLMQNSPPYAWCRPAFPFHVPRLHRLCRTDGYQRVCHELEEIKRAAQTRQPWTFDELVRTTSGVVSFLETIGKLIQTVLQHDTGDYLVINAENAAIVRRKITEVLLYRTQRSIQVV